MEKKEDAIKHLREHQQYPASKADLVAACNNLSDFSEVDKKEFIDALPDQMFSSAEEVITALGW